MMHPVLAELEALPCCVMLLVLAGAVFFLMPVGMYNALVRGRNHVR